MDDLGWRADGTIEPIEGLDARAVVDKLLRPLAIRLRVSKKDQEHCRQIIATLHRMVPVGSMHRNTRRSVLRRISLPHALTFLGTLAEMHAGEYAEAESHWRKATSGRQRREKESATASPPRSKQAGSAETKQRRRRRGPRGGAARQDGSSEETREKAKKGDRPPAKSTPSPSRPKDEKLPPVWDDGYFFAALPSVPEGTAKSVEGNRYGSPDLDPRAEVSEETEKETAPGDETEKPKRRRRPRRRRKTSRSDRGDDQGGSSG
jgi:hypothetical protein